MILRHAFAVVALGFPLAAQAASSPTYFLVDGEIGPGGPSQSFVHRLTGTSSSGAPAARAISTGFVLLGGYPAAIEAPATGTPWLSGVAPAYAPLLGGTALTLHGTELNLGPTPSITIGGVVAVTGARTHATIQTTLPSQPRPGYRPLVVQNSFGTSTLPHGLGVLPLIDLPVARQDNVPLGLRYLGAFGDQIVPVIALATSPFPFPLPPFHHALELDVVTMVVLSTVAVTDPSGTLILSLPGVATPVPIFIQAFVLTQNPGWFPGSFTNFVRI